MSEGKLLQTHKPENAVRYPDGQLGVGVIQREAFEMIQGIECVSCSIGPACTQLYCL